MANCEMVRIEGVEIPAVCLRTLESLALECGHELGPWSGFTITLASLVDPNRESRDDRAEAFCVRCGGRTVATRQGFMLPIPDGQCRGHLDVRVI